MASKTEGTCLAKHHWTIYVLVECRTLWGEPERSQRHYTQCMAIATRRNWVDRLKQTRTSLVSYTHCTLIQHTMRSAREMAVYVDSWKHSQMSCLEYIYKLLLHCSRFCCSPSPTILPLANLHRISGPLVIIVEVSQSPSVKSLVDRQKALLTSLLSCSSAYCCCHWRDRSMSGLCFCCSHQRGQLFTINTCTCTMWFKFGFADDANFQRVYLQ